MTPEDMARLHAAAMTALPAWDARAFGDLLQVAGTFVIGDDRAFALGRVILDEAELLTLATHPDHRRKGLARACLHGFHANAAEAGARRAMLEVAADNTAAQALYSSESYHRIGQRRGYYRTAGGPPVDAVLMTRALPLP